MKKSAKFKEIDVKWGSGQFRLVKTDDKAKSKSNLCSFLFFVADATMHKVYLTPI